MCQSLTIGVGNKKINTLKIGIDHVVDSVASGTANTNNGDTGAQFLHILRYCKVNGHD
jgi:hypothetical protein